MRFKKFYCLLAIIFTYIGASYLIFNGPEVITSTSGGRGSNLSSGGFVQKVGIGDTIIVTVTHYVKYNNYYGFVPVPARRGNLDLSQYHFYFFYVFVPIFAFICIIHEIYVVGKKWEKENIEIVFK